MRILQEEAELAEIVKLVGVDSLSAQDRLTLETARSLREDFLHQNAFHDVDSYCSSKKMNQMIKLILKLHNVSTEALNKGVPFENLEKLKVKEEIAQMKYIPETDIKTLDKISNSIEGEVETQVKVSTEEDIVLGF